MVFEEVTVQSHFIVISRECDDHAVQRTEDGDQLRRKNQTAACISKEVLRYFRAQIQVIIVNHIYNLFLRQNSVDRKVKQSVQHGDGADTDDQCSRQISARILHFFRNRIQIGPSFICPECCYRSESDHAQHAAEAYIGTFRNKRQVRSLFPQEQSCQQNDCDWNHLGNHGHILKNRSHFNAKTVICCQTDDQHDSDHLNSYIG